MDLVCTKANKCGRKSAFLFTVWNCLEADQMRPNTKVFCWWLSMTTNLLEFKLPAELATWTQATSASSFLSGLLAVICTYIPSQSTMSCYYRHISRFPTTIHFQSSNLSPSMTPGSRARPEMRGWRWAAPWPSKKGSEGTEMCEMRECPGRW